MKLFRKLESCASVIVLQMGSYKANCANQNRYAEGLGDRSRGNLFLAFIPPIPFILVNSSLKAFETGIKGMKGIQTHKLPTRSISAHTSVHVYKKRIGRALEQSACNLQIAHQIRAFRTQDISIQPDGAFAEDSIAIWLKQ